MPSEKDIKAKVKTIKLQKEEMANEAELDRLANERIAKQEKLTQYRKEGVAAQGVSLAQWEQEKKAQQESNDLAVKANDIFSKKYENLTKSQANLAAEAQAASGIDAMKIQQAQKLNNLAGDQLQVMESHVTAGRMNADLAAELSGNQEAILSGQMDAGDKALLRLDLEQKILEAIEAQKAGKEGLNKDEQAALASQLQLLDAQEQSGAAMEVAEAATKGADAFTGGMYSQFLGMLGPLALITALMTMFEAQTEDIANEFGAIGVTEMRADLAGASQEFVKMGLDGKDALTTISSLNSEFGIGLEAAREMSKNVGDVSKSLGISVSDSTKLMGTLTTTQGLSADQAEDMLKQTASLAKMNGVAPKAVLEDIAGSTSTFANFAKDGGENIIRAAIQAKKLGINLDTVAGTADSLLDFQSSLNSEVEASMMLGRQVNLQKARELSLAGDLEGLQKEIVKQVGSEEEFNKMNVLQRKSLAQALGMDVANLQKVVSNQKESVSLQGELAKQDISNIVPEETITATAELMAQMQAIGMELAENLGPTLSMVAGFFSGVISAIESTIGIGPALIAMLVYMNQAFIGTIISGIVSAVSMIWSGIGAMIAATAGFGTPIALALGAVAVAALIGSVMGAKSSAASVEDAAIPSGGGPVVATPEGKMFEGIPNDDVLMAPGVASMAGSAAGGKSVDTSGATRASQKSADETSGLRKDMADYFGVGGRVSKQIGSRVGDKLLAT